MVKIKTANKKQYQADYFVKNREIILRRQKQYIVKKKKQAYVPKKLCYVNRYFVEIDPNNPDHFVFDLYN